MATFIEVQERKYGSKILLNIDNIAVVIPNSGTVYVSTVHGEQTGSFDFDMENMQKILTAIKEI